MNLTNQFRSISKLGRRRESFSLRRTLSASTMVSLACQLEFSMGLKRTRICLCKVADVSKVHPTVLCFGFWVLSNAFSRPDLGANTSVRELILDAIGEKIIPCPEGVLCAPLHPHEQVEWRSGGTELRIVVDHKVQCYYPYKDLPLNHFFIYTGRASHRERILQLCSICGFRQFDHRLKRLYRPTMEDLTRRCRDLWPFDPCCAIPHHAHPY